jgi:CheY-like chemotaxis protein
MDQEALRVLIVDDDAAAAIDLERLLHAHGHTVHVSYRASDALELAVVIRPHLILHDIVMPTMGGYEAARRLRAIPVLAHTLLIACSGSINERKVRQAGFNGWLIKPVRDADLQTIITIAHECIANTRRDLDIGDWFKQPD